MTDAAAPAAAPSAAPAPTAEVEKLSYPPDLDSVRDTPMESTVRNWREQAKRGVIHLCADDNCYYPVNPIRPDSNGNELVFEQTKKGRATVAECSWDPRHCGGKQLIYPPAQDDAI